MTSRRSRETIAHGYKRPSASLGNEVGGLSTALGLFASPPLILSTESVVVIRRGDGVEGHEHVLDCNTGGPPEYVDATVAVL